MNEYRWIKNNDGKYSTEISDWNGESPISVNGKAINLIDCKRHYTEDNDLIYWSYFDGQYQYIIWND